MVHHLRKHRLLLLAKKRSSGHAVGMIALPVGPEFSSQLIMLKESFRKVIIYRHEPGYFFRDLLAELHGGSVTMNSEPGVGTTVTIRFPAERVEHASHDPQNLDTAHEMVG